MAGFSLLAYLPFFDNGFISDDWVILDRAQALTSQPFHLFDKPPDQFRLTSYLSFLLLHTIFGQHPWGFYIWSWGLHLLNVLLTVKLGRQLFASRNAAWTAALCLAVLQNPHEAVAWLSAMNESLMTLFALLTAIAWMKGRRAWAALAFLAALFSKESAVVLLALLPLLDWVAIRCGAQKTRRALLPGYGFLLLPAAVFGLAYWAAWEQHSMLQQGYYRLGPQAAGVMLWSLHRLAFPYLYLALSAFLADRRRFPGEAMAWGLGLAALALLPYCFLTYQGHVASRHTYLASVALCLLLGVLLDRFSRPLLRWGFVALFLVGNGAYLWLAKDAQLQARAAPTTELRRVLTQMEAQPVLLPNFPLNPWMARLAARSLDGWTGRELRFADTPCPGCPRLLWKDGAYSVDTSEQ
ncbi:MAG TPA: hypothetical protein VLU25_08115 [Acidobacteriota bacterium]|nr:hypothetical protein [Acidobacteriota bacterium]